MSQNILDNEVQLRPNLNANTASTSPFICSIPTNQDMYNTTSHIESKDTQ
jgi:hypothetical protein